MRGGNLVSHNLGRNREVLKSALYSYLSESGRRQISEPRITYRVMEEGCKRTREERNETLREEWDLYNIEKKGE